MTDIHHFSNRWRESVSQIYYKWKDVKVFRPALAPDLSSNDRIIIDRHDTCTQSGRDRAELPGVAPDVEHTTWRELFQRVMNKSFFYPGLI